MMNKLVETNVEKYLADLGKIMSPAIMTENDIRTLVAKEMFDTEKFKYVDSFGVGVEVSDYAVVNNCMFCYEIYPYQEKTMYITMNYDYGFDYLKLYKHGNVNANSLTTHIYTDGKTTILLTLFEVTSRNRVYTSRRVAELIEITRRDDGKLTYVNDHKMIEVSFSHNEVFRIDKLSPIPTYGAIHMIYKNGAERTFFIKKVEVVDKRNGILRLADVSDGGGDIYVYMDRSTSEYAINDRYIIRFTISEYARMIMDKYLN